MYHLTPQIAAWAVCCRAYPTQLVRSMTNKQLQIACLSIVADTLTVASQPASVLGNKKRPCASKLLLLCGSRSLSARISHTRQLLCITFASLRQSWDLYASELWYPTEMTLATMPVNLHQHLLAQSGCSCCAIAYAKMGMCCWTQNATTAKNVPHQSIQRPQKCSARCMHTRLMWLTSVEARGMAVCRGMLKGVNTLLQHPPVMLSHQDQVYLHRHHVRRECVCTAYFTV